MFKRENTGSGGDFVPRLGIGLGESSGTAQDQAVVDGEASVEPGMKSGVKILSLSDLRKFRILKKKKTCSSQASTVPPSLRNMKLVLAI